MNRRIGTIVSAAVVVLCLTGSVAAAQGPAPIRASFPLGRLLPDSELVLGPTLYGWDTTAAANDYGGYLSIYSEVVDGAVLSGPEIVDRVASELSVGQRVLLTLIEMHSGWITDVNPAERTYPVDEPLPGLRSGLARAATTLNRYYYAYHLDEARSFVLADGAQIDLPTANAGTYAVVAYLSRGETRATWPGLEKPSRFHTAWTTLFGDPYEYKSGDVLPEELPDQSLALPFEESQVWYYVAGPYEAAGPGTPWAAIDFAPPPEKASGCHLSLDYVTAAARGKVVRSSRAEVVIDTDDDGFEGSGWVHVYRHLSSWERVEEGESVATGEPIGHPSCEGGAETVTRVAFMRRYNGQWIPANRPDAPLVMDGWVAIPGAEPRAGWLMRSDLPARQASIEKSTALNGVAAFPGER